VVLVNWQTASALDNDYFIIERSKDGIPSERIGIVQGAGNSNIVLDYEFVDQNPYSGTSYYRLIQVDYDGQSETFDWVAVAFEDEEIQSMNIFPNPLSGNMLNIETHNLVGNTRIVIYDLSGREVFNAIEEISSENHSFHCSLDLPVGIYNIQLINNRGVIVKRLIIK
jgi:hypothetical protein